MNITVLGCGNIGGTLGKKWARAGHTLTFGARHPDDAETQKLVQSIGPNASLTSFDEAIPRGAAVLFAIPGSAVEQAVAENGAALAGKIVIDASNKVGQQPAHNRAAFTAHAPTAQWVRAFNHLGWENFEDPRYGDDTADLFFCGAPGEARAVVEGLIGDVGRRPGNGGAPARPTRGVRCFGWGRGWGAGKALGAGGV